MKNKKWFDQGSLKPSTKTAFDALKPSVKKRWQPKKGDICYVIIVGYNCELSVVQMTWDAPMYTSIKFDLGVYKTFNKGVCAIRKIKKFVKEEL